MFKYIIALLITTVAYGQQTIELGEDNWPYVFPNQVEGQPFVYTTTHYQNYIMLLDFTADGFMDYLVVNGEVLSLAGYQETGVFNGPASDANYDAAFSFMAMTNVPTNGGTVRRLPAPEDIAHEDYNSPGGYLVFPMATNYLGCAWWAPPMQCWNSLSCETLTVWDKVMDKLYGFKELSGEDNCRLVVLPPDGKLIDDRGKTLEWDYRVTRNGTVVGHVYRLCKKMNGTKPARVNQRYKFYRRNRDTGFEFGPVPGRNTGDTGLFVWPGCGRPFYMRPRKLGGINGPDFPGGITADEFVSPDNTGEGWYEDSPVPFTWNTFEHCINGHPLEAPILRRYPHMENPCVNWLYHNEGIPGRPDQGSCACP